MTTTRRTVGATHASPLPSHPSPLHRSERRHRGSVRLRGYDYTQAGAYFVTICTQDRRCLFGEIVDGEMRLNDTGRIVEATWREIAEHCPRVSVDEYVVMPNHVHGVLLFDAVDVGATHASPLPGRPRGPSRRSVGSVIGSFKSAVTKRINDRRAARAASVWQRNYYEHVIRNDASLMLIRQYIHDNPAQWSFDRENPDHADFAT